MQKIHENIGYHQRTNLADRRDKIDLLQQRADLLVGKDKLIMKMYLQNGNSFRQIARLAGVSEGTISRKIKKLSDKLLNSEYITCLRHRELFSSYELQVAKEHFLLGLPITRIARKRKTSYYKMRELIKKINCIIELAAKVDFQLRSA